MHIDLGPDDVTVMADWFASPADGAANFHPQSPPTGCLVRDGPGETTLVMVVWARDREYTPVWAGLTGVDRAHVTAIATETGGPVSTGAASAAAGSPANAVRRRRTLRGRPR